MSYLTVRYPRCFLSIDFLQQSNMCQQHLQFRCPTHSAETCSLLDKNIFALQKLYIYLPVLEMQMFPFVWKTRSSFQSIPLRVVVLKCVLVGGHEWLLLLSEASSKVHPSSARCFRHCRRRLSHH